MILQQIWSLFLPSMNFFVFMPIIFKAGLLAKIGIYREEIESIEKQYFITKSSIEKQYCIYEFAPRGGNRTDNEWMEVDEWKSMDGCMEDA